MKTIKEKEAREKLDKISKCNRKRDGRADFLEGYRKCKEDVLKLIEEHKSKDGIILKHSVIRLIKRITG